MSISIGSVESVKVLKRTRKSLMILEAGFIYCQRRNIPYSDDSFIDDIFMSEEFQNDDNGSTEFDIMCRDLRMFRYYDEYELEELSIAEYESCADEFNKDN